MHYRPENASDALNLAQVYFQASYSKEVSNSPSSPEKEGHLLSMIAQLITLAGFIRNDGTRSGLTNHVLVSPCRSLVCVFVLISNSMQDALTV